LNRSKVEAGINNRRRTAHLPKTAVHNQIFDCQSQLYNNVNWISWAVNLMCHTSVCSKLAAEVRNLCWRKRRWAKRARGSHSFAFYCRERVCICHGSFCNRLATLTMVTQLEMRQLRRSHWTMAN